MLEAFRRQWRLFALFDVPVDRRVFHDQSMPRRHSYSVLRDKATWDRAYVSWARSTEASFAIDQHTSQQRRIGCRRLLRRTCPPPRAPDEPRPAPHCSLLPPPATPTRCRSARRRRRRRRRSTACGCRCWLHASQSSPSPSTPRSWSAVVWRICYRRQLASLPCRAGWLNDSNTHVGRVQGLVTHRSRGIRDGLSIITSVCAAASSQASDRR